MMFSAAGRHSRGIVQALLLVLLVSCGAQAQKIRITYDKGLDFSKFKTFSWAPWSAVAHPMLAADIMGAIEEELAGRGLHKVDSNPDLVIKVYGSIDQESTFYSNDPLYMGTGGIPLFDPSMNGPADVGFYGNTTVTIHKGEMVVDLIQVAAKKLVWRGVAQENLSHDPNKLISQVNNVVAKLFKQYPPKT